MEKTSDVIGADEKHLEGDIKWGGSGEGGGNAAE